MSKVFGGGSKSSQKSTTKQESTNTNLLTQNGQYVSAINSGINEGLNANIIPFELAGMSDQYSADLAKYGAGVDYNGLNEAYKNLTSKGAQLAQGAESSLSGYLDTINKIAGYTPEDYREMYAGEYNNDLVQGQINELTKNVQEQESHSVQSLNQQAGAAGGMGNSRAGVAQGVIAGNAAKAIATGTVQYQTAEEQLAMQRVNTFLGNQFNAVNAGAGIVQGQQALGYNLQNQGMGYYTAGLGYQAQNNAAAIQADEMRRQYEQQELDIKRQNQMMYNTPLLTRLGLVNSTLAPVANFLTNGNSTGTTNVVTTQPDQNMSKMFGMIGTVGGSMFGPMGSMIGGMAGTAIGNSMQK